MFKDEQILSLQHSKILRGKWGPGDEEGVPGSLNTLKLSWLKLSVGFCVLEPSGVTLGFRAYQEKSGQLGA